MLNRKELRGYTNAAATLYASVQVISTTDTSAGAPTAGANIQITPVPAAQLGVSINNGDAYKVSYPVAQLWGGDSRSVSIPLLVPINGIRTATIGGGPAITNGSNVWSVINSTPSSTYAGYGVPSAREPSRTAPRESPARSLEEAHRSRVVP